VKIKSLTRAGPTRAVSRLMLGCLGADAQIAAGGNTGAAAGASAGNGGNRRHAALFELGEHAVDARFIFKRVLRRGEGAELIDIGAGRECLVAGALQHQHLDRTVAIGLVADFRKPLIHRKRKRIARLRTIERDAADAVAQLVENVLRGFLGGRWLLAHIFTHFRAAFPGLTRSL